MVPFFSDKMEIGALFSVQQHLANQHVFQQAAGAPMVANFAFQPGVITTGGAQSLIIPAGMFFCRLTILGGDCPAIRDFCKTRETIHLLLQAFRATSAIYVTSMRPNYPLYLPVN